MMKNDIPFDLIAKYLSGACSEQEIITLNEWKKMSKEHIDIFNQMEQTWTEVPKPEYTPDVEKALSEVSMRLPKQKKLNPFFNQNWVRIAAVLIFGLGLFSIYSEFLKAPKLIEISTLANSELRDVLLPDGSKVTLSRNSTISYPEQFKTKERRIQFTGEGYFEIIPDKKKPFYIESGITETRVVGTAFNLRVFKNDSVAKITVTEGIVSFNLKDSEKDKDILVKAGEVGKIDSKNKTVIKEKNTDKNFMAWRNGKINFESEKLGRALRVLSEYYGKSFIAEDNIDTITINAYFDSFSLPVAKQYMEQILDVTIYDEGDIFVLKAN